MDVGLTMEEEYLVVVVWMGATVEEDATAAVVVEMIALEAALMAVEVTLEVVTDL